MDILDEDVPHRSGDKTRIKKAKKKKGERSFWTEKKNTFAILINPNGKLIPSPKRLIIRD